MWERPGKGQSMSGFKRRAYPLTSIRLNLHMLVFVDQVGKPLEKCCTKTNDPERPS